MTSSSAASVVYDEIRAIVAALVGGARYGVRIRLPHAAVMTALFRKNLSAQEKLRNVLMLVREHASNLAVFAALYKTILALLKLLSRRLRGLHSLQQREREENILRSLGRLFVLTFVGSYDRGEASSLRAPPGHPERIRHSFIAGAVSGYFVWGRYSSVNYQIVLYLASRIMVATWKRMTAKTKAEVEAKTIQSSVARPSDRIYPAAAAAVWGVVMALFEECPDMLQPSLKNSMEEIYRYRL